MFIDAAGNISLLKTNGLWGYKKENEMGTKYTDFGASQEVLGVKNQTANAGNVRNMGSIPGWGGLLEEGMATH